MIDDDWRLLFRTIERYFEPSKQVSSLCRHLSGSLMSPFGARALGPRMGRSVIRLGDASPILAFNDENVGPICKNFTRRWSFVDLTFSPALESVAVGETSVWSIFDGGDEAVASA